MKNSMEEAEISTVTYTLLCEHLIASGNLLCDAGNSNPVLCVKLQGWELKGGFQRNGTYVYLRLIYVDVL